MAMYKEDRQLKKSIDAAFDQIYKPGDTTPHSGIYNCINCGDEIASNSGNPLPSQNHAQHAPGRGDIRWQMIVYSEQKN